MNDLNMWCNITKVNDEERIVEGYASTEAMDVQGEIVEKTAIEEALPEYMRFGNIREMHQPSAVGKAVSASMDDKGLFISVKVVDDSAWNKVKEGVYNGFSIGGKKLLKIGGTISKLRLTEISLVDRPANPEAIFNLWKGDGMADEVQNETDVNKSIWDVNRLGEALFYINEVKESQEWAEMMGDDNSESKGKVIEALKAIAEAYKSTAAHEADKIVGVGDVIEDAIAGEVEEAEEAEKSEEVEDIAKAGASISKANKQKLQDIMNMCKEMMGDMEDEAEKSDESSDLEKGEDLAKSFDDLQKAHTEAMERIAKMDDRIKELEAIPEAPKGVAVSVSKSEDVIKMAADEKPTTAFDLIKMAHSGKI